MWVFRGLCNIIHDFGNEKHSFTSWCPFKICSLRHMSLRCVRVCVCVYDEVPELWFNTQGYCLSGKKWQYHQTENKWHTCYKAERWGFNSISKVRNLLESAKAVNTVIPTTMIMLIIETHSEKTFVRDILWKWQRSSQQIKDLIWSKSKESYVVFTAKKPKCYEEIVQGKFKETLEYSW